jgi:WD40 repeat protein
LKGHTDGINTLKISNDGKYIYSAGYDHTIRIWDFRTGIEINSIVSQQQEIRNVFNLQATGETYIIYPDEIKVWDFSNLEVKKRIPVSKDFPFVFGHSDDGKILVFLKMVNLDRKELQVVNTTTGKEMMVLKSLKSFYEMDISPDQSLMAVSDEDMHIYLWELATGVLLKKFAVNDEHAYLNFTDNNTLMYHSGSDSSLNLLDVETGQVSYRYHPLKGNLSFKVLRNEQKIIGISTAAVKYVWDLKTKQCQTGWTNLGEGVKSSDFSNDGRKLYYLLSDKLKVKDLANQYTREIYCSRYNDFIRSLNDTGKVLVASRSGEINLYDIHTEKKIVSVYTYGNEWIAITPDGYFTGTPGCNEMVSMVKGNTVTTVDQFAFKLNRPDLLLKRLGNKDTKLQDHYYNRYKKRMLKAGIDEKQMEAPQGIPLAEIMNGTETNKNLELHISFSSPATAGNLKSYNVYVNNVPLYGQGKALTGKKAIIEENIALCSGENKVEVSCMTTAGVESYRALWMSYLPDAVKGDLYFLAFGVSKYKHAALDLQYADKDAVDLGALIQQDKSGFYHTIHSRIYVNSEVTVASIREAKSFVANAKPDDTFILFIAGHGLHDRDANATYYYLTHETDVNMLATTAADFDLIEELLQHIRPRKKIFFMDTCESGEAEEEDEKEGEEKKQQIATPTVISRGIEPVKSGLKGKPMEKSVQQSIADRYNYIYSDLSRRSGAVVFSSSKGGEKSYETVYFENGVFTEMIMKGLQSEADTNKDHFVTKNELFSYVLKEVSAATGNGQHPVIDRDNTFQKIVFPVIK